MKKVFKVIMIILGVSIVIFGGLYIKKFYIGTKDYTNIKINNVSVGSSSIVINGEFIDAKSAYKSFDYTLVGTELYVSVNNVLSSNKYNDSNFVITINENGLNVNNIHLTDDKNTKVIYSK